MSSEMMTLMDSCYIFFCGKFFGAKHLLYNSITQKNPDNEWNQRSNNRIYFEWTFDSEQRAMTR